MGKVDFWNIDIVDLIEKYIECFREMKEFDLCILVRVILVVFIFVRMKSEVFLYFDEE